MKESQKLQTIIEAGFCSNEKTIQNLLSAVSTIIPCKMCSIWSVDKTINSVSILAREGYCPNKEKEVEFCHDLNGSLIGYSLDYIKKNKKIYLDIKDISKSKCLKYHKSIHRVKELDLCRFVSIPIPNSEKWIDHPNDIEAVLNIYPQKGVSINENIVNIIRDQFSLSLSRCRYIIREKLISNLIDIYKYKSSKDIQSVFYKIITKVLPAYIKFEGCSIFTWDTFNNRLQLIQTTGLEGKPKKNDVFYYLGEGITGIVSKKMQAISIKDLNKIENNELSKEFLHKFREETNHIGKSFMAIPIMSPSKKNSLVGVIRFTNKINMLSNVIDFFSENDKKLIEYSCNLLALFLENEQVEKEKASFVSQAYHEMFTPAFSIRGTADRLYRKRLILTDMTINSNLMDIIDQAELQIALTRSSEYLWKGKTNIPKIDRYDVGNNDIYQEIIKPSIKLVIPIARTEDVLFKNITHSGFFSSCYCDKFAFRQVFFNLLTNAIKYRDKDKNEFFIEIKGYGIGQYKLPDHVIINSFNKMNNEIVDGILINVIDNGIGIEKDEINKIFNLGYRTKGIEKRNVRGLGMGLSVTYNILRDFGCHIWVEHNRKPTIFSILIPSTLFDNNFLNLNDWKI